MINVVGYLLVALELIQELLVIGILIICGYAGIVMTRTSRKNSKEIELISKRFEILMGMPLKKAREILKDKDVE